MTLHCDHFDAGRCRSCTLLPQPYADQLAAKQASVEQLLPGFTWLPPQASPQAAFRNKAKMVVTGTVDEPRLGIVSPDGTGVDLRDCGLHTPGIVAALGVLAEFVTTAALAPYDIAARRGELKHLLVTESPDGELMVRFVLRSTEAHTRIVKHLPALRAALPQLRVASLNLQSEHKAVLEGEQEILLTEAATLPMRVNDIVLQLRPQGFFQTNTAMAAALYARAEAWIAEAAPATVLDLYCGVGGFALHAARTGARAHGVEVSAEAVEGARLAAAEAGLTDRVRFTAADATGIAALEPAELVVVNPPRRGIGPELAGWLEAHADRVVYSSCNPVSLARDLAAMPSLRPGSAQLVDMFPHTGHGEVLVTLTR